MPRPLPSWEQMQAQYERAETRGARSSLRLKARKRAARAGCEPPAWAALQAKSTRDFNRPKTRTRPARAPAPRKAIVVDAAQIEIPEAVREWRAQRVGRVIVVNARGLTLIDVDGSKPVRFKSAAAAIAALAALSNAA